MNDSDASSLELPGHAPGSAVGIDTAMSQLRMLAQQLGEGTDWSRCDDHQVVALLEGLGVQAGRPRAAAVLYRVAAVAAAAAAPAAASAAPRSTGAQAGGAGRQGGGGAPSPAAPAAVPERDAVTLAASLRVASEQGVPFVEECLKEAEAA